MPTLYSYCTRYDDGAAPNPHWGVCSLAICKPVIRRTACTGDWVVGTGSKRSPIGDVSGQLVYAMRVTDRLSMAEYDSFTRAKLPQKIPDRLNADPRRRVGDSIYDFQGGGEPHLRPSVHNAKNRDTDLGGKYVLLSTDFFYFGDRPVVLPHSLMPIVKQGQGHRSRSNGPHLDAFVAWIRGLGHPSGKLLGDPQMNVDGDACAVARCAEAEEDERLGDID